MRAYKYHLDNDDPFWRHLTEDECDFLQNDNQIMMITILKQTIDIASVFTLQSLYSQSFNLTIFSICYKITESYLWWYLIWNGTRYEIFFSNRNLVALFIFFTIDMALILWNLLQNFTLNDLEEITEHCAKIVMLGMNLMVTMYIYGILFYYGIFKINFRIKINNVSKKLEKK
jgi:hypothetical protein